MEREMNEVVSAMESSLGRLLAAASALEGLAVSMSQVPAGRSGEVEKITAAIDAPVHGLAVEGSRRERELLERLAEAEQTIASLRASSGRGDASSARKTLPAATLQLLAKSGIDTGDAVDVQSLDVALAGLSIEQRMAVKSQMMRTGSLTLPAR